ncbi:restriction endonuclease subunit S [Flavobacterium sp.]|jgi:type I restriction enzyme S subunit|uniref:restriction endonuclease subunit S n=1 Tax=Flavobacterium sp. TaxID=239 RepID=UPI0037BF6089
MTNLKEYKLSDLMEIKYGKDHKHLADGSYPLFGSGGIMRYVEKSIYEEESILIPRKGTLSNLFYVNEPFWSVDTMFWSKIKQDLVLPKYLYYTLKTYNLAELNVGSAVPSLTTEVLNKVLISIPDKNTQTSITEILTSLDDKIELNNKINHELETLAQTLFKQWFIDFEFPNENGEPYKSSGGEMADSELGVIPKGWGVGSIYEISDVIYGAPFKSKLFNQEGKGFPLIRIRDMKTFQPQNWTEEVLPKGTKIVAGDLIVGMDAEFRPIFWLGQPAWLNQRLCYFNPKKGFSKLFVREIIRPQLAFFENSSVGTTVIHLGKADIDTFKSIIPNKIVMGLFEEISNSIFEKIINNSKEKNQLTYLRDLLLKKLITGDLEINEINN